MYELVNTYALHVERQKAIPVIWKDEKLDLGFRADLVINKKVIVEIKSIESLAPVHYRQVLTYIRILNLKLGLLVNFNEELLKKGIKRIVNNI